MLEKSYDPDDRLEGLFNRHSLDLTLEITIVTEQGELFGSSVDEDGSSAPAPEPDPTPDQPQEGEPEVYVAEYTPMQPLPAPAMLALPSSESLEEAEYRVIEEELDEAARGAREESDVGIPTSNAEPETSSASVQVPSDEGRYTPEQLKGLKRTQHMKLRAHALRELGIDPGREIDRVDTYLSERSLLELDILAARMLSEAAPLTRADFGETNPQPMKSKRSSKRAKTGDRRAQPNGVGLEA